MNRQHVESGNDNETAEGYRVELPVELEERTGITSSVSTNRVVFKSDCLFVVGEPIRFRLVIKAPGKGTAYRLHGEGTVIHVERTDNQPVIKVDITTYRFYEDTLQT